MPELCSAHHQNAFFSQSLSTDFSVHSNHSNNRDRQIVGCCQFDPCFDPALLQDVSEEHVPEPHSKLKNLIAKHSNDREKSHPLSTTSGKFNATEVTEFVFLVFSFPPSLQYAVFSLFLLLYTLLLCGNIVIMLTIRADYRLHNPMYFFLGKLSFIDLCYSSVTVPKMLVDFLSDRKSISFNGCITQLYFLHFFGCAECFLFTAMAYDRYVAICKPLQYSSIMSKQLCLWMVAVTWTIGFVHSNIQTTLTMGLPFCDPNEINSFVCDVPPLIRLACTDTNMIDAMIVSNSGIVALGCFLTVLISYIGIGKVIFKIRNVEGRRKAFSTCSSHLTVVTLFFGPCVFIYMRPSKTFQDDELVTVFYTVIAPMLNPIIYTLRNEEIKTSIKNLWRSSLFSPASSPSPIFCSIHSPPHTFSVASIPPFL
ncbi:olfactory receptor 4E2-like [Mixophyes fleayi]|uniref:olfactory receptor 4E2-like n=1 Tax=Mixophyes fleayi TaxID=3061075 RepID=UPI003F4D72BD